MEQRTRGMLASQVLFLRQQSDGLRQFRPWRRIYADLHLSRSEMARLRESQEYRDEAMRLIQKNIETYRRREGRDPKYTELAQHIKDACGIKLSRQELKDFIS